MTETQSPVDTARQDAIDARWQAIRTVYGRLHIMDRQHQEEMRAEAPEWRPRAMCGVGQASRRHKMPLREEDISVATAVDGTREGENWCPVCLRAVRNLLSIGSRKMVTQSRAQAGSSTQRVLIVGPINRSKHGGSTYPGFRQVAQRLRESYATVIDPADTLGMFNRREPYADHVRAHMELFWEADAIIAMEGWEGSNVATLMVLAARSIRLPIMEISRYGAITASEHGKWADWCSPFLMEGKGASLW